MLGLLTTLIHTDKSGNTEHESDMSALLDSIYLVVFTSFTGFWIILGGIVLFMLSFIFADEPRRNFCKIVYGLIAAYWSVILIRFHIMHASQYTHCHTLHQNTSANATNAANALLDSETADTCYIFNTCGHDYPQNRFRNTELYYFLPSLYFPLASALIVSFFSIFLKQNEFNMFGLKIGSDISQKRASSGLDAKESHGSLYF